MTFPFSFTNSLGYGRPLTITDLTVAWDGLTAADVGYVDGEILAGDYLDFQIDTVTTFDGVDLEETSELLDAGEISGGTFEVVLPTLAEDTWYIRVRVRRGSQVSAWSAYDTYSAAVVWTESTGSPVMEQQASTTVTFSSIPFSDGDAIVAIGQQVGGRTFTGVTLGGNAMTKILDLNSGGVDYIHIYRLNGVTAGSYNVVVTGAVALFQVGMYSGTLSNAAAAASDTAVHAWSVGGAEPHTTSTTLDVPANGFGFAVTMTDDGATTWASPATDQGQANNSGTGFAVATYAAGASTSPSHTGHNGDGVAIASISWAPA
jgi:hypothetical protein